LVELTVALMVATLAAGAIASTVTSSIGLSRTNRERGIANDAANVIAQQLRSTDFTEVFVRYNATNADDPAVGVSPGSAFDVAGLRPTANDADGRVGEIIFPGDGVELWEDVTDRWLGMPRDLNGDGDVLPGDRASFYRILPVRVRVTWQGTTSSHTIELVTVLNLN